LPDERATIAAIAKVDQIAMAHAKDRRGYPIAPAASVALHSNGPNADMPPGSIAATAAAEAAVAHWLVELRRKARSAAFARSIGRDMPTLAHLVSELAAGAVRVDLAGEIARAYRMSADARRLPALASGDGMHRSLGLEPAADDRIDAVRMAAYSCRITAAYLEVLGDVACRGADARSRSLEVDIAATPYAGYPAIGLRPRAGARRNVKTTEAGWERSFRTLVDDNIAAAQGQTTRSDKDRELGELLHLFTSSPFEVDV
jgi:hypothetical protein